MNRCTTTPAVAAIKVELAVMLNPRPLRPAAPVALADADRLGAEVIAMAGRAGRLRR